MRPALDRIVSLRRTGPAHAHGAGARAVHARPPRVPARRVRGAGLASPIERRRAAAAVARGDVRPYGSSSLHCRVAEVVRVRVASPSPDRGKRGRARGSRSRCRPGSTPSGSRRGGGGRCPGGRSAARPQARPSKMNGQSGRRRACWRSITAVSSGVDTGSSSPRPRLTRPPREGLAFHRFHWQGPGLRWEARRNGSSRSRISAHQMPRKDC